MGASQSKSYPSSTERRQESAARNIYLTTFIESTSMNIHLCIIRNLILAGIYFVFLLAFSAKRRKLERTKHFERSFWYLVYENIHKKFLYPKNDVILV